MPIKPGLERLTPQIDTIYLFSQARLCLKSPQKVWSAQKVRVFMYFLGKARRHAKLLRGKNIHQLLLAPRQGTGVSFRCNILTMKNHETLRSPPPHRGHSFPPLTPSASETGPMYSTCSILLPYL